jgi:hypothetical protein
MNPMMNFQPNQRNALAGSGGNRTLSQHYLGGERGFQIIACEVRISPTTCTCPCLRGGLRCYAHASPRKFTLRFQRTCPRIPAPQTSPDDQQRAFHAAYSVHSPNLSPAP